MRILVTGANGQVGYCLKTQLAESDFDWVAYDRNELDIADAKAVRNIVKNINPDVVINAAAYTAVDQAEQEMEVAYKINADGAGNLAQSANEVGAAIFHISTDYVFAGDKPDPYIEDDKTNPQSIYGKSKLEGERLIVKLNPKHIILRTSWVFCEHGKNFVKTMLKLAKEQNILQVVSDQQGAPTYAGDIAAALIKIADVYLRDKELQWGIYHFTGSPFVSWYLFANEIFNQIGPSLPKLKALPTINPITTTEYRTPAKRPMNSRLESNKIDQVFQIKPSDWKKALSNLSGYPSI